MYADDIETALRSLNEEIIQKSRTWLMTHKRQRNMQKNCGLKTALEQ